ncbi:MAG: shikimate kinase [Bacteroidia bacterium]|nr:shikimate kinase [Bacteroidia bacterium]
MKIVLLGYMASGKSSIGKKLAKKLNLPFKDLDELISKKEELSIPEIFKHKGEIYFRKIESEVLQEFLKNEQNFVLAVGGGTPCYGKNLDDINRNTTSVYLNASIKTIYNNLSKVRNKDKRPLISKVKIEDLKEFIAKHLFERRPFYEGAHLKIDIDHKTQKEITEEISLNMR